MWRARFLRLSRAFVCLIGETCSENAANVGSAPAFGPARQTSTLPGSGARSSVGQSSGLIIRRSQVRVLPGPLEKALCWRGFLEVQGFRGLPTRRSTPLEPRSPITSLPPSSVEANGEVLTLAREKVSVSLGDGDA